ncbi:hypothetical protein [uncultured Draconibacterium sp.]|uniref:hypothetical protein n=1 Tax=uncultured Draconibacterium sp. TaxID=1573823 RepID=UPI00326030A2
MLTIIKSLLLIFLTILIHNGLANTKKCRIVFEIENKIQQYSINDTIVVWVKVELDEDFCDDAGDITKVFAKGLKICERSEWKRIAQKKVGQQLTLAVLKGKGKKMLTAYRKTGHYNCFNQVEFNCMEKE